MSERHCMKCCLALTGRTQHGTDCTSRYIDECEPTPRQRAEEAAALLIDRVAKGVPYERFVDDPWLMHMWELIQESEDFDKALRALNGAEK